MLKKITECSALRRLAEIENPVRAKLIFLFNMTLSPDRNSCNSHVILNVSLFSTCIFCGEKNEDFARDGLEQHYWANCPMLRRCQECNQVCLSNPVFLSS
jgi:hypothetical protein